MASSWGGELLRARMITCIYTFSDGSSRLPPRWPWRTVTAPAPMHTNAGSRLAPHFPARVTIARSARVRPTTVCACTWTVRAFFTREMAPVRSMDKVLAVTVLCSPSAKRKGWSKPAVLKCARPSHKPTTPSQDLSLDCDAG